MDGKRFAVAVVLCALITAAICASLNALVDPYLLFDRPRIVGFNAVKPAVETREPMMKAYQVTRLRPKTLILGSSRTDIGLDPDSPAWPEWMRPIYNLSLAGSDVASQLRLLRGLLETSRTDPGVSTVIVGLDFESFLRAPRRPPNEAVKNPPEQSSDEESDRLAALRGSEQTPVSGRILRDYALGTLTLDALLDSASTIAANHRIPGIDLQPNGRLTEGHLRRWTKADGAGALFEQKNRMLIDGYCGSKQVLLDDADGSIDDFKYLLGLIELSHRHHFDIIFIVQPAHAQRLELLDALGYWPDYERWKRELASLVNVSRASSVGLTVWDFGGYDQATREAVPRNGDRGQHMNWFWDPVHYTVTLGNEMIGAMYGRTSSFPPTVRLSPDTIEARLAQIREDRAEYRATNGEVVAKLRQLQCASGGRPREG
jgi:hypothetical protein